MKTFLYFFYDKCTVKKLIKDKKLFYFNMIFFSRIQTAFRKQVY
ncbi:hypothetical protein BD94_0980 [Elizabethkingia anophelis NUHP1]|uniref:Uncharacterized protein n=1 Tax=Elizabethkingia anophelis NUHP1 TaxID=1338011 RepID=A0A077EGU7_9FLAO|nr:hypothetical protein BD94_0980 [Elizabethkingia anophelis NUHP1]